MAKKNNFYKKSNKIGIIAFCATIISFITSFLLIQDIHNTYNVLKILFTLLNFYLFFLSITLSIISIASNKQKSLLGIISLSIDPTIFLMELYLINNIFFAIDKLNINLFGLN